MVLLIFRFRGKLRGTVVGTLRHENSRVNDTTVVLADPPDSRVPMRNLLRSSWRATRSIIADRTPRSLLIRGRDRNRYLVRRRTHHALGTDGRYYVIIRGPIFYQVVYTASGSHRGGVDLFATAAHRILFRSIFGRAAI